MRFFIFVTVTWYPGLILEYTVSAPLQHVYKYTQGYDTLYPDADKVIIRSDHKTFWLPEKYRVSKIYTSYIDPQTHIINLRQLKWRQLSK